MITLRIIALFTLCFYGNRIHALQAYCAFDADIKKIYAEILNLDLDLAAISLGMKPDTGLNKAYVLLENEIDFFRLFIYEKKAEYEGRKFQKNKRLHSIKNSNLSLEWKRFLQAEILLQWALIFLKQEDEIRAFQSIRESIQLLEDNASEFPDFVYTYKSLGILHTLLSTIPEGFQWAAWLLGLSGHLQTGKYELEKYIRHAEPTKDLFLNESYAAMSFIISYLENKPETGYQYWKQKIENKEQNPLEVLVEVKMAIKAGFNDAAIQVLQSFPDVKKDKLPLLHLLQGLTTMQKLDANADQHFHKFLKLHKGAAYIKESYQKLAWISLLKGETGLYHLYMSNCLTKGNAFYDEDKQAKLEALSGNIPDQNLLKARLLFDGGYIQNAYDILIEKKEEYYSNPDKKREYAYRMGRICQMKKEPDRALQFYKEVIQMDPQFKSYMSCNALLNSGIIYESQNKKEESYNSFRKVLKTDPDQYKRSIHQKAKAGVARLKN